MPANVETMFSVRQVPWHRLGVVLPDAPTIEDGIVQAGLNWRVDANPVYDSNGVNLGGYGQIITRSDNNQVLGIVGPNYTPVQNIESFEWFRPFIENKLCSFTSAGSLDNGKVVWVMAEINNGVTEITANDHVRRFVLISNSHDGSKALRVGFTPIRVVCANTLAMAHNNAESRLLKIKHTKKIHSAMSEIQSVIRIANNDFEATFEQYRSLAKKKVSMTDLRKYVKIVITKADNDEKLTPVQFRAIEQCVEYATRGRGQTGELTAWAAYNGVTEFYSYGTNHRTVDARFDSLWYGENRQNSARALELALAM